MKEKMRLSLVPLLFVYIFLVITLLYSGSANAYNLLVLLYVFSCSYIVGSAVIPKSLNNFFFPVSHGLLSILIGGLILSPCIFITVNPIFLLGIFIIPVIFFLYLNRDIISFSYKISLPDTVAPVIALLLMFFISKGQLVDEFSSIPTGEQPFSDTYFFTSIVSTIRNGSLHNAVYEAGSPIIYQDLGFFIPGMFARVLNITSHQALWGIAQPFYKILAILLCYDLFFYFFKDKVSRSNYLFMVAALCFPLLLAPLHPLYLIKLNVHNFIFSGMGYLLPTGTVTYPLSIILELVCVIIFSVTDWKSKGNKTAKIFFAILFGLIIIAKLPMYVAFLSFMFMIVLYRVVWRKERLLSYLPYALLSVFIAGIAFKLCMGYPSLSKTTIQYGYLVEYFSKLYKREFPVGFKNNLLMLVMVLCTYLVWLGIRCLGLIGLLTAKKPMLKAFFLGAIFSLFGSTLIALSIRAKYLDSRGNILRDGTFDVEQLIRSSFYIVTIVSAIGLFYYILNSEKKIVRNVVSVVYGVCWHLLISLLRSRLKPRRCLYGIPRITHCLNQVSLMMGL